MAQDSTPVGTTRESRFRQSFEPLLTARTDDLAVQVLRSIIVGAIATLVDMGVLHFLVRAVGLHYMISAAISFTAGLSLGYVLNIRWVFAFRTFSNRTLEFALFTAINVVGLGATEAFLYVFVERLHLHYMIGKSVAVIVLFGWNFGLRRALLFRKTK